MFASLVAIATLALAQAEPSRAAILLPPLESARIEGERNGEPATEENGTPSDKDRWLLLNALDRTRLAAPIERHRLAIYGWTDVSFTASSAGSNQLPMGFNYLANQFLLQQNWLRLERSVVTEGATGPTLGFRCDTILPGSDYRFTVARGLFDGQLVDNDGQPNRYGIDPIQFYLEAYFPNVGNGLDVKIGRIFCQYGIESNEAISNALGSRCYTFIYNPFTHTGLMGTLKLDDAWSVQAGIMAGNDVFIDPASEPYGMGSVKWAPPEGKRTLLFSVILGSGRFNRAENFHNPQVFDLVYTQQLSDKLKYSFEGLYGFTNNVPNIGFASWFGILNYLTYDFTPKVSGTARLEFFDDIDGQRTGFAGLYTAITAGLSFKPRPSIIIRPELRYDTNSESRPFENRHGLFTATADVIFRW